MKRSPQRLDESVAQTWRRRIARGRQLPLIQKPDDTRCEVSQGPQETMISLPPGGLLVSLLIYGFVMLFPLALVGSFVLDRTKDGDELSRVATYVCLAVIILPGLFLAKVMILPCLRRGKIWLNEYHLKLRVGPTTQIIPLDELEECLLVDQASTTAGVTRHRRRRGSVTRVEFGGGAAIRVASDRRTVAFGQQLSDDDRRYIHAVLNSNHNIVRYAK